MKGNEAIAHAAIRCGTDDYFSYPITPQSEMTETLAALRSWEAVGMVAFQAENKVTSVNMIYGGTSVGKRVLTSSLSPSIALMQEGISYMVGAELPGVFVNVQHDGPGLGTIQPSQSDYFQATRGDGNGDYNMIVLAPNFVQEMADSVGLTFELAFRYRNPAMIFSDGAIDQMIEKVVLSPQKPRRTEEEVRRECPWVLMGHTVDRNPNITTSSELKPEVMKERNLHLQEKYRQIRENEVHLETQQCEDADYTIVSFGNAVRIGEKAVRLAHETGSKVDSFCPITLWSFPSKQPAELCMGRGGALISKVNAGQMVQNVRLTINGALPVEHSGRLGGIVPDPKEIVKISKEKLVKQEGRTYIMVNDITPPENLIYEKPTLINDTIMHYCPSCPHGVVYKLIAKVTEEMGMNDKATDVCPVGCTVFAYRYLDIDWQEAPHGRTPAVATGIKRLQENRLVFTYQGDGNLACAGTAETIHALSRGENISIIFINNVTYGMTDEQMAPTALMGQKTTTCPYGRGPELHGCNLNIMESAGHLKGTCCVTRQGVDTIVLTNKTKRAIREVFEASVQGKGSSLVEIVATRNSGWKLTSAKANEWMRENMFPEYEKGDLRDIIDF